MSAVQSLSCISLICREPERLARFYETAFGFVRGKERSLSGAALESLLALPGAKALVITMGLGAQTIELIHIEPQGQSYPAEVPGWNSMFQHFAIVVSDMAAAYAKLSAQEGWRPISTAGPQLLPAAWGGVTAFKFRDPEGHPLELLAFPPGAVPEPWQKSAGSVFLGIDHSAISVADTSRGEEFYSRLGFRRSGGSLNTGPTQDRLDGVRGAAVEVTALSPLETPPHLELLCYREASGHDAQAAAINDVAATGLVLTVKDAQALTGLRAQTGPAWVAGPIPFEDGVARAILRDPDGHVLRLEAPL